MRRSGQSGASFPEVRQSRHYDDLDWPVLAAAKEFRSRTRTGLHRHDRAQLIFAISGLMVVSTPSGTWLAPKGYAVWAPPNLDHDVSMHGAVSMRTAYVRAAEAGRLSASPCVLRVRPLLEAALMELEAETRGARDEERLNHLTWIVLDEIRRAPATQFVLPLPVDARVARIAQALIAEPGSSKTIDGWCDLGGLSRRTMTRLFRAQTGLSFGEWRSRLRMVHAAARIADGETLADVAASLAYRNVPAFRAMARKKFDSAFADEVLTGRRNLTAAAATLDGTHAEPSGFRLRDVWRGSMTDEDQYRKRAEALLKAASETDNMKLRGELIDQAMHWHNLAMEAHEGSPDAANDDGWEARA